MNALSKLTLAALSLSALSACISDIEPPRRLTAEDEALVRLQISAPGQSLPGTRAITGDVEHSIENLTVLVLTNTGTAQAPAWNYSYRAQVSSTGTQSTDQATNYAMQFTALLKASPDAPIKLVVLANVSSAPAITVGMSEADIYKAITEDLEDPGESGSWSLEGIPMYGQAKIESLPAEGLPDPLSISLLRSMAKFTISVDSEVENFLIKQAFVYRPNTMIQVAPNADAVVFGATAPFHGQVTAPSVPDAVTENPLPANDTKKAQYGDVSDDGLTQVSDIFVPESVANSTFNEATCVVVGGLYDSDNDGVFTDETLTYYRIDIAPGVQANDELGLQHPAGEVLRNYHYQFNIKKVSTLGWEDPDDAANNNATTMVAEISAWNDATTEMFFLSPGNYIGFDTRNIVLGYPDDSKASLFIETNVSFNLTDGANNTVAAVDGATYQAEALDGYSYNITVKKVSTSTDKEIWQLIFTADQANTDYGMPMNKVSVVALGQTIDVSVFQNGQVDLMDPVVRILSIGRDYGSMGDQALGAYNVGYGTDGQANYSTSVLQTNYNGMNYRLRDIISNKDNFGPSGKVKCGGFYFETVQQVELSAITDGSNHVAQRLDDFRKMLNGYNIIFMAYNVTMTEDLGRAVADWVAASPKRFLFLTCDLNGETLAAPETTEAETSNKNLRKALAERFGYKMNWQERVGADWTTDVTANNFYGNEVKTTHNAAFQYGWLPDLDDKTIFPNSTDTFLTKAEEMQKIFFEGPFGKVDKAVAFPTGDYISSWVESTWPIPDIDGDDSNYPTGCPVIPLIMSARASDNTFARSALASSTPSSPVGWITNGIDAWYRMEEPDKTKWAGTTNMVLGVDYENGIVYCGENDMFGSQPIDEAGRTGVGYGPERYPTGSHIMPEHGQLNLIWANMFAWIVERCTTETKIVGAAD